ncbi:MAG: PQQ-dependent sugar dehydrogenase [Rhizomicrobium sp.]|jgi:glucose/arabinose dehydrogenase
MHPKTMKSALALGFLAVGLIGLSVLPGLAADQPGQHFSVLPQDMPKPFATPAADNSSKTIPRPAAAMPSVPAGFAVSIFASGLTNPRWMAVAPNGDVFLSEPKAGKITLLRDTTGAGHADRIATFATGFSMPHGLAFHDGALYVADLNAVYRLGYRDGALKALSKTRVTKSGFGVPGGHFTRDIAFDNSGHLYLAIGSAENIGEDAPPRATVQLVKDDGTLSTFVSGIRNPVGIAAYPGTDDMYATVNERDGFGDGLVPDYFTRIQKGDFFGWPYAYIGPNPAPDYGSKRPDLVAKTKVPDLLFQSHSAPLGLVFYEGNQFPAEFKGDAFVSLHGSWNSSKPTGYKVVRIKFANGRPIGGYDNFVTGFWDGSTSPAQVWGRPVGLAVAKDGSLLIADDTGKVIWRVAYTGK